MSQFEIPHFSDQRNNNEADYANYRLKHVIQSGPLIIALPTAFNFFMLFADLNIIQEQTTHIIILFIRVLYSFCLLLLLVQIKKIPSFPVLCRIITCPPFYRKQAGFRWGNGNLQFWCCYYE